jgi:hypothetical protein
VNWLRRNRWGLVALAPAVAAVVALSAQAIQTARDAQPRVAVPADADGWYHLADARMRLSTLEHATGLVNGDGQSFTAPRHVVVWRATIGFDTVNDAAIGNCHVSLEDDRGRTYDSDPELELAGSVGATSRGCLRVDDSASRYTNAEFFALPDQAQPVAIRVVIDTYQPLYVRLPKP